MPITKIMHAAVKKLMRFMRWWHRGLLEPWQRWHLTPRYVVRVHQGVLTVVRLDAEGRVPHQPLELLQWLARKRRLPRGRFYLLVPPEQVMATPVSVEQRSLLAADIAAEMLPFEAHELVVGITATREQLYSALCADIQRTLSEAQIIMAQHSSAYMNWSFSGVAFATDTEWLTTDTAQLTLHAEHNIVQQTMPKRSLFVRVASSTVTYCVLGLIVVWIAAFAMQQVALHEQQLLRDQLSRLTTQSPVPEAHPFAAVVTHARPRSVHDTLHILNSLVTPLRADDVLSQLILTNDHLLLDASSSDASGLQLALREVPIFDKVEFVAGITAQATSNTQIANPQERFRLKVVLPTAASGRVEEPQL